MSKPLPKLERNERTRHRTNSSGKGTSQNRLSFCFAQNRPAATTRHHTAHKLDWNSAIGYAGKFVGQNLGSGQYF